MKIALVVVGIVIVIALIIGSNKIVDYAFLRPKQGNQRSVDANDDPLWKKYATLTHVREKEIVKDIKEEVQIKTFDGLTLTGYYVPAKKKTNIFVIGFHGYKDNGLMDMGLFEPMFHGLGFNMLIPDNRAHGKSEGKYIGFGILDSKDCISWCEYVINRFGQDSKILLFGMSMGGATVLTASGNPNLPKQVFGIISDSGFSSPRKQIGLELKKMHLPAPIFVPIANLINRFRGKFSVYSSSAIRSVQNTRVPILLIHGTKDNMVPVKMAHDLYKNIPTMKDLEIFEEAGHSQSIVANPERYEKIVTNFLNKI